MTPQLVSQTPDRRRTQALRQVLEAQRDRILHSTRQRLHDVREEGAKPAEVHDTADLFEADIQSDLDMALLAMQSETLAHIDAALAELDEGSYGRCIDCGHEIATRRLEALPFAVRCTACEGAHETATAHPAGASRRRWHFEGEAAA